MKNLRTIPLAALAGALLCVPALVAQQAAAPTVRIVSAIDESKQVTLHGTVHPLATAANDRGAAPDNMQLERLHLVLKRSADQESALRQFIAGTHATGSPSYHKWLTPDEFGTQFGPSDQDIATVENWLQGRGFSIAQVNPGKQTIEISGTVAQLRSAFHTQIHKYVVNGEAHYANSSDPSIPAALAPVVGGFVSLNNFRLKSYAQKLGEASYNPSTGLAKPSWTLGSGTFNYQNYNFPLSPADYAVQYDLNKLYTATGAVNNATGPINGTGEAIAVVNDSNINVYLVNQFRSLFGLSANPPQVIIDGNDPGVDGINNPDGPNYDSVEAYLDVEWSGAVAPDATVDLVIGADTALSSGLILAAEHAVYGNVAPIISLSFGGCEQAQAAGNQGISMLWEQAAAQGQTVIVSTGDNGSAGCDGGTDVAYYGQAVNGLASTPYNVAVGGTDFYYSDWALAEGGTVDNTTLDNQLASHWTTTASNATPALSIKGVIPEQPWNNSQFGDNLFSYYDDNGDTTTVGGGGGASNCVTGSGDASNGGWATCTAGYAKPSFQTSVTPADAARDLPDVSLFAANGYNDSYYPICATDGDCTQTNDGFIQIFGVGGTSASTPSFAGIMALVDQSMAGSGNPDGRQGQADYILYPLFTQFQSGSTKPYNDVTNGTISEPCDFSDSTADCIQIAANSSLYYTTSVEEGQIGSGTTPEYNAGTGYDLASGLGTIDAYNLVTNWSKVSLTASATTLNSVASSLTLGDSVTFSGTVTGNTTFKPTGTVALMTDSTEPLNAGQDSATLASGGSYSMDYSSLPGGTYNIWTHYSGDSNNAPSDSVKTQITVSTGTSTVDFNVFSPSSFYAAGASIGSVDYGTQLELSAYVTTSSDAVAAETCLTSASACNLPSGYPMPTGTVTFADNGSPINTAVLNATGEAAYNPAFAVSSVAHSITASYTGDQSYSSSNTTSKPITFTVVKDTPNLELYVSLSDSAGDTYTGPNQPLVFTVVLLNGAQFNAATSTNVYPAPVAAPTGSVTASGFPSGVPTSETLTAEVDPFNQGGTQAVAGVANFILPAGTTVNGYYNLTFCYGGDGNYNALSGSNCVTYQQVPIVNLNGYEEPSVTTATISATTTSPNASLVVNGTVTGVSGSGAPGSPTTTCTADPGNLGYILVYANGYYINQVQVVPGTGIASTFSVALNSQNLIQGANQITLQYYGDCVYNPSAFTLNSGSAISNPLSDFTLVPSSAIVSISGDNTGTDTLNLTSMNGFTGTVTLTCSATSPLTCSAPNPTLASMGSASQTLTITPGDAGNGTYNVLVTATSGNYVHTAAIKVVISNVVPGFTTTSSGDIATTGGAITGNTSTITVAPAGGFTGTVSLSCAVTTALTNPTSAVTCGIPASVDISGTSAQTTTLTATSTSTTTIGAYAITVTAISGSITKTTVVNVAVDVALALTPGTPSQSTVSPGGTSTDTIKLGSAPGFSGTVTLACSVSPSNETYPPTCTLSGGSPQSNQVTYTNGTPSPTSLTATVTTTAATSGELVYPKLGKGKGWMGAGGGAVLAVFIFLWIPARRRNWLYLLGLLVLTMGLGSLTACGGGGGGGGTGGGGSAGTTAGLYTFTVTASGTNVSSKSTNTFTVTVN